MLLVWVKQPTSQTQSEDEIMIGKVLGPSFQLNSFNKDRKNLPKNYQNPHLGESRHGSTQDRRIRENPTKDTESKKMTRFNVC
jgi:hypothetical protein